MIEVSDIHAASHLASPQPPMTLYQRRHIRQNVTSGVRVQRRADLNARFSALIREAQVQVHPSSPTSALEWPEPLAAS